MTFFQGFMLEYCYKELKWITNNPCDDDSYITICAIFASELYHLHRKSINLLSS